MNIVEPRPTEELLRGMAQQSFSGWTSEKYRSLSINQQNGFTAMFDQCAEFFFACAKHVFRAFALGDVLIDTIGFDRSPLVV
jgi:hypothetical protein